MQRATAAGYRRDAQQESVDACSELTEIRFSEKRFPQLGGVKGGGAYAPSAKMEEEQLRRVRTMLGNHGHKHRRTSGNGQRV